MHANIDWLSNSEPVLSYPRTSLLLGLLIALTACAFERPTVLEDQEGVLATVKPAFPRSERKRGREGWVIVAYAVDGSGSVNDVHVTASSGSLAFEEAALEAIRQWRYVPGDERNLTLLVTFLNESNGVQLSPRFIESNKMVHEFIDYGRLDAAEALLTKIRSDDDLTASELAYTFLADERIAGLRGHRKIQLESIRLAMLYEGRWLLPETYVLCLHDAILLEVDQGDYASALRDYELLAATTGGGKLAANLEETMRAVRERLESENFNAQPYLVADSIVSVKQVKAGSRTRRPGFRNSEDISAPDNPRGAVPPPKLANDP